MTTAEMLRPYIQEQVAGFLGVEKVTVDPDGDIPIRQGSAVCFVRLLDGPTGPMLRVLAPLLKEVEQTPQLFERLNELNTAAPYVRFFWAEKAVFCAMDLFAEDLERDEIGNALGAVMWHADNLDDTLKERFGGKRMVEGEDPPKPAPGGGGYL